jgi:hypothetical protein
MSSSPRLAIVTGGNNGFGWATSRILLVDKGFEVVILCRNVDVGKEAVTSMNLTAEQAARAVVMRIDLSDLTTVVSFVADYVKAYGGRKLDYLILNAGIVKLLKEVTPQGLEETIGVNHFGGAALFNLLLKPVLIPSRTRVVAVGSLVHNNATFTAQNYRDVDLTGIKDASFSVAARYADSKLLNHLWGFAVHKRFADKGVTCNSVHPGSGLFTNLGRRDASAGFKMVITPLLGLLSPFLWCCGFFQTWHDGGVAELAAAEAESGGTYFYRHYPSTASATATNDEVQNWAWDETKRILADIAAKHNLPADIAGPEL